MGRKPKEKKKVVRKPKKAAAKKRGRPPKTSTKKIVKDLPKKKRGRPPKKKDTSTECDDYIPPKSYKFLGYCSKRGCEAMIGTLDLAEGKKTIFKCSQCGKRDKISKLKKERSTSKDRPKTKREFLQATITYNHDNIY